MAFFVKVNHVLRHCCGPQWVLMAQGHLWRELSGERGGGGGVLLLKSLFHSRMYVTEPSAGSFVLMMEVGGDERSFAKGRTVRRGRCSALSDRCVLESGQGQARPHPPPAARSCSPLHFSPSLHQHVSQRKRLATFHVNNNTCMPIKRVYFLSVMFADMLPWKH